MYLQRADLRRMAGEVIIAGFVGTDITAELREVAREVSPLGYILFARNIEAPQQLVELNGALKGLRKQPTYLSVDQEGGRVARVRHPSLVHWPAMAKLGGQKNPNLARQLGAALAAQMAAVGFDGDFAPVLDVHTNPANPVIGERAFGETPELVASCGAAFIEGMQANSPPQTATYQSDGKLYGIAACGKHFPGHGDTAVDSHLALPTIEHDARRLAQIEWPPFVAGIAASVAAIMTAHVMVPALDDVIATLSPRILTGILRQKLGFAGAIISDDIDMAALADHADIDTLGPRGLQAGVDIFLACKNPAHLLGLYAGIVRAAESGELPHQVLAHRAKRATMLRKIYARPVPTWARAKVLIEQMRPHHEALLTQL